MGLFLFLCHKLIYIALTLCKNACKVDCDIKTGIDPLPFGLDCEQKMLGFLQLSKPIKYQDLLEKMAAMRLEQVQRFILAKKIFWGYGHFNPWECELTDFTLSNAR